MGEWNTIYGMTAQYFPVQHSILDENALAEWASARYLLKNPVRCRFLRQSMSDVYRVDTRDATYILKVYAHHRHTKLSIEAEVNFLNDLRAHDIPVAAPVANHKTIYVNELNAPEGTRYAILFEAVTGAEPREIDLAHSRSFGQLAGRIHCCSDRLGKVYHRGHLDEKYLIEEPLGTIEPYLQHRKEDSAYLRALGDDLSAELQRLVSRESPEYGLCHGDLHTGNARSDKDGRLTLFDFDSFGYGWRAIDIGVYHVSYDWMSLSEATQREKARFWAAFVEGYNTQRPLHANELTAAQLCLPIRHLELMGITIRYWSPQIGSDWINDAYFDQHLDWFRQWNALSTREKGIHV